MLSKTQVGCVVILASVVANYWYISRGETIEDKAVRAKKAATVSGGLLMGIGSVFGVEKAVNYFHEKY